MAIINIDTSTATKSELTAAVSALMSAKAGIEDAEAEEVAGIQSDLPAYLTALQNLIGPDPDTQNPSPDTSSLGKMLEFSTAEVERYVGVAILTAVEKQREAAQVFERIVSLIALGL